MAKNGASAPEGMVARHLQAQHYVVLTSNRGPLPEVVPETWRELWHLEDQGKLKRAYQADFEIYDQRAQDPHNGQVDIYVGMK
jgi:predicted transcriptional regulator YdeE